MGSPGYLDFASNYDVTASGERFVMIRPVPRSETRQSHVVLNGMKALLPQAERP
jgi:hypothetical protein